MSPWLRNSPAALLSGLVLGVALQEALRKAFDAFVLLGTLNERLAHGETGPGLAALLLVSGLIGGGVAGLVTALLGRRLALALLAGVLLAIPAVILAAALREGAALAALHAVPPVCGAAFGARLAIPARQRPPRADR
ncbi:hypothetical protein HFP89_08775 [Wenzhouxiangella sp. XN79A]|uniref:hypothetical protein n=1 Tax=Wenzhouxiangella sp. XN79A TaxID=2724193 RepID=UPI00144AB29C|nr:hypothetical protein [Wenzhouxiangella sp. XN79A]NKI35259.1 hypothetical protein [Wenzhouxiangella sp. XN79A]